jgi:WD40 repeat protein
MAVIVNGREYAIEDRVLDYEGKGKTLIGSMRGAGGSFVGQLLLFPRALDSNELTLLRDLSAKSLKIENTIDGVASSEATSVPDQGRSRASEGVQELRKLRELNGPKRSINRIRFAPHGRAIVAVSDDPKLWVWDVGTGVLTNEIPVSPMPRDVCIAPDGTFAVVGGKTRIEVIKLNGGDIVGEIPVTSECQALTMTPDGRFLIYSDGATIVKHDLVLSEVVSKQKSPHSATRSLNISGDGGLFISTGNEGLSILWSTDTMQSVAEYHGQKANGKSKAYDADISINLALAVSCTAEPSLHVWSVPAGNQRSAMSGHDEGIKSVRFVDEGRRVVSGGYDGTLRMWDTSTGKQLWIQKAIAANSLAVSADGRYVGAAGGYISRMTATPELESLKVSVFEVP